MIEYDSKFNHNCVFCIYFNLMHSPENFSVTPLLITLTYQHVSVLYTWALQVLWQKGIIYQHRRWKIPALWPSFLLQLSFCYNLVESHPVSTKGSFLLARSLLAFHDFFSADYQTHYESPSLPSSGADKYDLTAILLNRKGITLCKINNFT